MSHRNANYESPDAIRLSLRESRLQRQLFVASSRVVEAIVSASVISVRINVQLEASLASRAEEQNRAEKAQRERDGRLRRALLVVPAVPSSYRTRFCLSLVHVKASHPRLVLARQNLTKQFAPKQTTASGLLVNKQHIYF